MLFHHPINLFFIRQSNIDTVEYLVESYPPRNVDVNWWMNHIMKILSELQESKEEEKSGEDGKQDPPPITKDNNPSNSQNQNDTIMF